MGAVEPPAPETAEGRGARRKYTNPSAGKSFSATDPRPASASTAETTITSCLCARSGAALSRIHKAPRYQHSGNVQQAALLPEKAHVSIAHTNSQR